MVVDTNVACLEESSIRKSFKEVFSETEKLAKSSTMFLPVGAPKFSALIRRLAPTVMNDEICQSLKTSATAIKAIPERNNGQRLPEFLRSVERQLNRISSDVDIGGYRPTKIFNVADFFKLAEDFYVVATLNEDRLIGEGCWCAQVCADEVEPTIEAAFKIIMEQSLKAE